MHKKGDITIDHCHSDNDAKRHCLVNDGKGNGYLMTTKKQPSSGHKTIEIKQEHVTDFKMKDPSYVSNKKVSSTSGHVIGKVKKNFITKLFEFLSNL